MGAITPPKQWRRWRCRRRWSLAAVPSFTVIASVGMNLHTLVANGGIGTPTYTIGSGNKDGHFALDAASGVLSLSANAKPNTYVLMIQAMDARANTAQAMVTVGVSAVLSLADAQRLGGAAGTAISLHTFVAQGGIGARTYTLLTDDVEDYFSLGAESGVLSLLASATVADLHLVGAGERWQWQYGRCSGDGGGTRFIFSECGSAVCD